MMKSWINLLLAAGLVACHTEPMKVTELKAIPDAAYAKGVSAPFCGVVNDALVVAGGANFPDKSLLEGGAKRVYADIWAFSNGDWAHAGVLPDSTAYGATFAVADALILAGGNVCGETTDQVY
ncbi:MAG: cyclically-permuted mutarotase family protein, partial [Bacteroidales bacterium]|nr:cyclically-permuted mutarotase family protein [Bacteroidales bacterium]